jgi:outer membrane protein TolC
MSSRRGVRLALCALLACLAMPHARARADEPHVLDERGVVQLVKKQNPELKATLARLEGSRQDVAGLSERYAPVIQLEGNASDISNPSLTVRGIDGTVPVQGINRNRTRRAELAAELRKHLIWGTDLTLRVSGNVFRSNNYRPPPFVDCMGLPADMCPSFTGGTAGFVFPSSLGPGYGVVAKLTLKQPLLRGFGQDVAEADLNAARVQRSSAEYTRDRVSSELIRDALTAYWELWYAGSALSIQQASRDLAARQRDDAQLRVDTGTLAPVEVLAFETDLATHTEDVASAEGEQKRAELELARLLGGTSAELAADDALPSQSSQASARVLEEEALANSAEVHEREAALELAQVQARTAADAKRHRLDLDSYVQMQGLSTKNPGDAVAQYGSDHAVSGFLGLTYEAPVNRRSERAADAKARAAIDAAEQDLAAVRQRVVAEAHKAEERARTQDQSLVLAEQTRAIAERQLAAEQSRFQSGTGTTLQVIVAEDRVRAAKLRVARAHANLAQTALSLDHLTGRLLQRWSR